MLILKCLLCSYKKDVLHFLEQVCSFFELNHMLAPSEAAESTRVFIDKVCELAETNGLSSRAYKSALSDFSADKLRKHLNKVFHCICALVFLSLQFRAYFYFSVLSEIGFLQLFNFLIFILLGFRTCKFLHDHLIYHSFGYC